ncbi:MAG: type II toxin-antitoxin system HicA family toxin [Desulfobacterales bacterium]|nr:MAG: type II toxin-antitoxin system HicA family toxin [Desulfobacterales bacterium]
MPSTISRKKLIQKLRSLGFQGPYSGGKHQFMIKGQLKLRIPNPHKRKDIHHSLVTEIINQAGISMEDWDKA